AQNRHHRASVCSGLLPKPKQTGDRRAHPPPAAGDVCREGTPPADRADRPRLLDPVVAGLVGVEGSPDHRLARHRGPMASQGLQVLLVRDLRPGPGRPPIPAEGRLLIRRFENENGWRARKVHAELEKLGIFVGISTVARYLPKRDPDRDQRQRWSTFLRNHRHDIAAMDSLVLPTVGFRLLYVWFVIGHGRRELLHFGVTVHPTSYWVTQQLREAFPDDEAPRFLIFENDSIFSARIADSIEKLGIEPRRTTLRSPWQNGIVQRWIGSVRRELLDHVIVQNKDQLRYLLRECIDY
ncbi:unnamed protein product, partial [Discosporangium mesarthrocarpum]